MVALMRSCVHAFVRYALMRLDVHALGRYCVRSRWGSVGRFAESIVVKPAGGAF